MDTTIRSLSLLRSLRRRPWWLGGGGATFLLACLAVGCGSASGGAPPSALDGASSADAWGGAARETGLPAPADEAESASVFDSGALDGSAQDGASISQSESGSSASDDGAANDVSPEAAADASWSQDATTGDAPSTSVDGSAPSQGTSTFRCVNWADPGDNFQAGVLQPTGLTAASDAYSTVMAKSNAILSGFETVLGANAIRIPINEATVVTNPGWWTGYKGIVDAAIGKNMKVMIGYWGQAGNGGGKPADVNVFFTMWQTVVEAYGANDLVYFDVMNEPWAYSPSAFIDLVVQWMGKFPSIPRSRVVVAGNYADTNVTQQGADPRLAGCLLSVHIYGINTTDTSVSSWSSQLATAVGPYASRTIVSEYGQEMTTGLDYSGAVNGKGSIAYLQGVTSQIRASGMGSCYWPGLRSGDAYSIATLTGSGSNLSLTVTNASGLVRIRSAWGL